MSQIGCFKKPKINFKKWIYVIYFNINTKSQHKDMQVTVAFARLL